MLRNFGKFILYLISSCAISGLAYWTGSDFINKFSESILPLLSAILAINITTSALLSGEIKKYIYIYYKISKVLIFYYKLMT